MTRRIILTAGLFALCSAGARGDVTLTVVEYRVLRELGQVRVTSTFLHDEALQNRMVKNRERFERDGLVLIHAESQRVFDRSERVGSHTIETRLTIRPAVGHGFRGGLPTVAVFIAVDGVPRIDCPYDEADVEFQDIGVLVSDGIVRLRGLFKQKSFDESVPLVGAKVVDFNWLMSLPI